MTILPHHPYELSTVAIWVINRAKLFDIDIIPDPDLSEPVAVNRDAGAVWVRPDLDGPVLHWWASQAAAFIELGPSAVREFIPPPRRGNVVPLLRRPW